MTAASILLGAGILVGPAMWLYAVFNVSAWLFVYFRMPDVAR